MRRYDGLFRNKAGLWACECGAVSGHKPEGKRCYECGGIMQHFDSQCEYRYFLGLKLRERAGEIEGLRHHVRVDLRGAHGLLRHPLSGRKYTLVIDFVYREKATGLMVFDDYKPGGRKVALEPLSELKLAILASQEPQASVRINGHPVFECG